MTQGAEQLLREFESGSFVRPVWTRPNPVSLARAVSAIGGHHPWSDDAVATEISKQIGQPDHTVFVIADGFGMNFVNLLPEESFSRSHLAWEQPAVFPSGTGPNMTSLLSGEWPAQHGFVGWWVYLPQIGERATVYEWVRASDGTSLQSLGVRPQEVFLSKPFPGSLKTDCRILMPSMLMDSVATHHSESGGAPIDGYDSLPEAVEMVSCRVLYAADRTITVMYWNIVDALAHRYGVSGSETVDAVKEFDLAMASIADALNGRARLIVTADHGHLDIPIHVQLDPGHELARLLMCTQSGDWRVSHFHVRDGEQERFAGEFETAFGEHFLLTKTDEVIDMSLFGPLPPSDSVRERFGNFTAISREGAYFSSRPLEARTDLLRSTHGGLSPNEMMVPVILA